MGYIEETGVAQHYRDIRIAPIYEGTNGIQAIDLVGRKLPMRGGAVVAGYLDGIEATAAEAVTRPAASWPSSVRGSHDGRRAAARGDDVAADRRRRRIRTTRLAGATPYLQMIGIVTGGWLLTRAALAARPSGRPEAAGSAPGSSPRSWSPPASTPPRSSPRPRAGSRRHRRPRRPVPFCPLTGRRLQSGTSSYVAVT